MNDYIVRWSGDCHIEAVSPEEAIVQMKKLGRLVVVCSSFSTRELTKSEKADVVKVKGDRR